MESRYVPEMSSQKNHCTHPQGRDQCPAPNWEICEPKISWDGLRQTSDIPKWEYLGEKKLCEQIEMLRFVERVCFCLEILID